MREVILDTETTGLSPTSGHRVVEIGCVELFNRLPTGRTYQTYINPERSVPSESTAITGLTEAFLRPHPVFSQIASDFLEFIQADPLVIHNASFDVGFLNSELGRLSLPLIEMTRCIDTLKIARNKFPGSPASLDALCKRFGVDLGKRDKHGALLDSELLAQVYLELIGGRQRSIEISVATLEGELGKLEMGEVSIKETLPPRPHQISKQEDEDHQKLVSALKSPLWSKLLKN